MRDSVARARGDRALASRAGCASRQTARTVVQGAGECEAVRKTAPWVRACAVARACPRVHAWAFPLRPPRWLSKGRALLRPECALRACECAVRARRVQKGETLGVLATAAMAQVIGDMGKRKRGIPAVAVLGGWRCRGESRPCRCSQCRAGIPSRGRGRSRRGDLLCSGGLGGSTARTLFLLAPPSGVALGERCLDRSAAAEWMRGALGLEESDFIADLDHGSRRTAGTASGHV